MRISQLGFCALSLFPQVESVVLSLKFDDNFLTINKLISCFYEKSKDYSKAD